MPTAALPPSTAPPTLETGNGNESADGRKVKGTIHWVSAHAVGCRVRLYDKLFTGGQHERHPRGQRLQGSPELRKALLCKGCKLEESLKDAKPGEKFQFVRTGFFWTPRTPAFTTASSPCATVSNPQSKKYITSKGHLIFL